MLPCQPRSGWFAVGQVGPERPPRPGLPPRVSPGLIARRLVRAHTQQSGDTCRLGAQAGGQRLLVVGGGPAALAPLPGCRPAVPGGAVSAGLRALTRGAPPRWEPATRTFFPGAFPPPSSSSLLAPGRPHLLPHVCSPGELLPSIPLGNHAREEKASLPSSEALARTTAHAASPWGHPWGGTACPAAQGSPGSGSLPWEGSSPRCRPRTRYQRKGEARSAPANLPGPALARRPETAKMAAQPASAEPGFPVRDSRKRQP